MTKGIKKLDAYYQKTYGISWKERMAIWKRQGGKCAICEKHERQFAKRLAVEHCHKTGEIRGLACFYCNKFLIGRHTLTTSKAVYEYLRAHDITMAVKRYDAA